MNILIADDEEGFRGLLHSVLSVDPTIQLSTAASAMEAWWFLSDVEQRFDLGIFDIKMPHINGFALLKRVRSSARYRHLPVIMCSGANDRETILQSGQLAANYYLVKPFKIESLLAKVHELGNRRRAAVATSRRPASSEVSASQPTTEPSQPRSATPLERQSRLRQTG
jgi:DNA-binding response OmpR family regulator